MADAQRDDNRMAVALGWDETNLTTLPLRVDPVTKRLLLDITAVTTTTPPTLSEQRDDNRMPTGIAVTDNAARTISPLIVDNRNGLLWLDVLVE